MLRVLICRLFIFIRLKFGFGDLQNIPVAIYFK